MDSNGGTIAKTKINISNHASNLQIVKDFASNIIGSFSGGMLSFAMGLMLLSETKSPISSGLGMIIGPIMSLLFLVPIGNIVDTYRHKNIILTSMMIRIITMTIFYFTINMFNGNGKLIPVIIFLSINSVSTNFSSTAYDASVHELVNDEKIEKLSSLTQIASSISSIFAPMLGVALYSIIGFDLFILIEIISSIFSLLITSSMKFYKIKQVSSENSKQSSLDKFKEGFNYIKGFKFVRYIIMIGAVFNFCFTSITIGVPYITKIQMHLGNGPVSVYESAASVGMLLGGLTMSIMPKKAGYMIKFILPTLLGIFMLISISGIAFFHTPITVSIFVGVIMIALMFLLAILNITTQVLIQKNVENDFLGRVMSLIIALNMSTMPLGALFFSIMFKIVSNTSMIFVISGLILLVYFMILLPSLLRMFKSSKIIS
ncbi:MFS transporter [Apilactobacillus apisilvae]|uniref:MFS transporter n=1 Tax=Apilactobacillus apisilvae TaxID=2923364 RepID=A0ABY4PFU1_9LACO|nr:MFS transporter [Apilactobacillus apisilvae]UQS84650.1 MFS transporter [Apilactobacillus apisilvae]